MKDIDDKERDRERKRVYDVLDEAIKRIKEGTYKNDLFVEPEDREWKNTEEDIAQFKREKLAAITEESEDYDRIKRDLDAEVAKAHEKAARRREKAKAKRE